MNNKSSFRFQLPAALLFVLCLLTTPLFAQGGNGRLKTKVKPAVAGVFVDGQYHGTASQFKGSGLALPAGEHKVKIVDPRYQTVEKTVTVEAGKTATIRENLRPKTLAQPPFGSLKIKKGQRAAVYLNGAYYGEADEFNGPGQALLLKPGEYALKIIPLGGGSPLEQKVTITVNRTTEITMQ